MTNDSQSTLLLYCCKDVKSHRSGGDTVPLSSLHIILFKGDPILNSFIPYIYVLDWNGII